MSDDTSDPLKPYDAPAGGWGSLKAVADVLADQTIVDGAQALWRANKPQGFDCPGCAWPDPKHTSSFEFCENGAKAVAWEATAKRATPDFFAAHRVSELLTWSDHDLEDVGRLTEPLAYDPDSDRYRPIRWDEAFSRIGETLRILDPDSVEFYASGRASNEACFLYGLFGRVYGTNNFPDCSNMCHEPTSVGLPDSIGVGKGSVSLEDFDRCDLILSVGHNPGTNHPRMMSTLRSAAKRGVPILVFNPMKERALERFANPKDPVEMAKGEGTAIASRYYQVSIGGDVAAMKGIMKALLALEAEANMAGKAPVLDHAFIGAHTAGFSELWADLNQTSWEVIERDSGLKQADLEEVARLYAKAKSVILCYGMGITQHRSSSAAVQQLVNLLLLRGNIGRPGAGICPLRGHSNVQGARTVGLAERPPEALLDSLEAVFGFKVPRHHGHNVVEAIEAMMSGKTRAMISLGGNVAVAAPDPEKTFPAMRGLDMTVNIATKLNRTHLLCGRQSFLLPCLGRTEIDVQESGEQAVTVEDSMAMVHASRGRKKPASDTLRSEPAIIAGIAAATLSNSPVQWASLVDDYDRIRDLIEKVFPAAFADYNKRIRKPGGFRLPLPHAERKWLTSNGKANFIVYRADGEERRGEGVLVLTSVRSHDQYNTTIYGNRDRYRGVNGQRDVVFVGAQDREILGVVQGDRVDIESAYDGETPRRLKGFTVVARELPKGSIAAYYPEVNPLVSLSSRDRRSGTPAYKSIPVRLIATASRTG